MNACMYINTQDQTFYIKFVFTNKLPVELHFVVICNV